MSRIPTTDNSKKKIDSAADLENLRKIADVEIKDLKLDDNPNLLVFPRDWKRYGDEISESNILSISGEDVMTGNIMGFVGINDTQLDIRSRFAQSDSQDYFLHYMLQKVFCIHLFDIQHTISKEPVFDFLLYLFPYFLKKALAQGVFKKYRRREYNDANVRGPIDVSRHISQNIPFRGTVAYSTREHNYDNEITQLIRHTIEYIRTREQGSAILNNDPVTKTCVSQIVIATQTYNLRDRSRIIAQNLRPMRHPYYAAYTDLQKICLQILRHESIKYGEEKDKVYGILFDGAWLWEEYLNNIFESHKISIKHGKNRTRENGISLYQKGPKYYPDFYIKDDDAEHSFVFDAKYKRLNKDKIVDKQTASNAISICRDDLFQMITYMHVLPAMRCALLYPFKINENESTNVVKSQSRILNGFGGEIFGYGLRIPITTTMQSFAQEMKIVENEFATEIEETTP